MADENTPTINVEELATLPFDDAGKLQLFKLLIQGHQELHQLISRMAVENNKMRLRIHDLEEAIVDQSEMLRILENRSRAAVVVKGCTRKPRLYQKVDDGIEMVART
jgi:hypothetical protein